MRSAELRHRATPAAARHLSQETGHAGDPIAGGQQVWSDRRVARAGEAIGDYAHVVVEAEDLVDH